MGLSRTVSEINGNLSPKTAKFSHLYALNVPLNGFPSQPSPWYWVVGTGTPGLKLECRGYSTTGRERSLMIISKPSGYNTRTWRTDTGRQQRPCLCIASRAKNNKVQSKIIETSFYYLWYNTISTFRLTSLLRVWKCANLLLFIHVCNCFLSRWRI